MHALGLAVGKSNLSLRREILTLHSPLKTRICGPHAVSTATGAGNLVGRGGSRHGVHPETGLEGRNGGVSDRFIRSGRSGSLRVIGQMDSRTPAPVAELVQVFFKRLGTVWGRLGLFAKHVQRT